MAKAGSRLSFYKNVKKRAGRTPKLGSTKVRIGSGYAAVGNKLRLTPTLSKRAKKIGVEIREGDFSKTDVKAYHDAINDVIVIDKNAATPEVVAHELGHAVDAKMVIASSTESFRDIPKVDKEYLMISRVNRNSPVEFSSMDELKTEFSKNYLTYIRQPEELFAEGYAKYILEPDKLKTEAPTLHHYFKYLK